MASTVSQQSLDVIQLTTENSALNAKMQLIIDQLGDVDLAELCKSAAASLKRRHDDPEDPDLHEGEREPKRQRTDDAPSSIAPAPSSQQQQQLPASTSAGKSKGKEKVGSVEVHSSELEVSDPDNVDIQSTDDIVNQPVGDFRIPNDKIDSLAVNERERQSVRDIRAKAKDLLASQPPMPEPTLEEEEEETTRQVAEDPVVISSDLTPGISTGPSQSTVEPVHGSQHQATPQQDQSI